MKRILRWLGLERRSQYVNNYFDTANFKAGLYMSAVVIFIELGMIIGLVERWDSGDTSRPRSWYIQHLGWYTLLLVSACIVLVFCARFMLGQTHKRLLGKLILSGFSIIALMFGAFISYSDYIHGEQILVFIMMVVFVISLLTWRPVFSISASGIVFLLFYYMIANAPGIPVSYATKINYPILWVSLVILALLLYIQRLNEAQKDESLEVSSIRDELTGIPNMFYFRKRATEILEKEGAKKKIFLFLDVLNFKTYNEKYGFDAGNVFISKMAEMVTEYFPDDLIARYNDDHFVVLTSRLGVKEKVEKMAENIRSKYISPQLSLKGGGYKPDDNMIDPSLACDHARYACSTIKKNYDKNYCEYGKLMDEGFHRRQYIVTHVKDAVMRKYIHVYYQPVMSAKDRTICGVEALARWFDPNYGFISPSEFIPILEEYQLIHHLDQSILEQVCKDIHYALENGRKVVPVSVNFSRVEIELIDTEKELAEMIRKYDIPPQYLHMEITESALTTNDERLKATMNAVKDLGIELWLDDFGSGYSSLNVLKDYNFDVMKIDMLFLQNFHDNAKSKTILKSIVKMANMIGMDTLTEGVEYEEQAEFLKNIGCNRLQGYLFSQPVPIDVIRERYNCF